MFEQRREKNTHIAFEHTRAVVTIHVRCLLLVNSVSQTMTLHTGLESWQLNQAENRLHILFVNT